MTQNSGQWPLRAALRGLNTAHTLTYQQFTHLFNKDKLQRQLKEQKKIQAPEVADLVPAALSTLHQPNTSENIFLGVSADLQVKIA